MSRLALFMMSVILVGCSHSQPKKVERPVVAKSFFDLIKSKKPKGKKEHRLPASKNSNPALLEFLAALKKHPEVLRAPIGYEVTKEYFYAGEDEQIHERTVYLRDNKYGYFSLDLSESEYIDLQVHHYERLEGIEEIYLREDITVKKISPTKFILISKGDDSTECQVEMDLTKSQELQEYSCKQKGVLTNYSKLVSAKPINPKDYASYLENIKLTVFTEAINCPGDDGEIDSSCNPGISDSSENDWRFIVK